MRINGLEGWYFLFFFNGLRVELFVEMWQGYAKKKQGVWTSSAASTLKSLP